MHVCLSTLWMYDWMPTRLSQVGWVLKLDSLFLAASDILNVTMGSLTYRNSVELEFAVSTMEVYTEIENTTDSNTGCYNMPRLRKYICLCKNILNWPTQYWNLI